MNVFRQRRMFAVAALVGLWMLSAGAEGLAQSLEGTWREGRFELVLVLHGDGTYALQYPGGTSRGRFGVQGYFLLMQDTHAAAPVQYQILNLTGQALALRDVQGNLMHFERQMGQAGLSGSGGLSMPPPTPASGRAMAQAQGYTLTSTHVEAGIGLVQFIIGHPVKPSEVKELTDQTVAEFHQEPAYVVQQLESIGRSLEQLRTLSDPIHIGIARQELFAALYMGTAQIPEPEKPLLIQVINRYMRTLAVDPDNKLILTDRDADGMIQYVSFVSSLSGQPMQIHESLARQIRSDLVNRFPSMPLEQKKVLCSAGLLWQVMESNWKQLSQVQQQQFRQQFTAQTPQGGLSQEGAYTGGALGVPSSPSMSQQMADFQARQRCMQMMMDMNTMSHATSLNIIENIGGTGNYWKVADY